MSVAAGLGHENIAEFIDQWQVLERAFCNKIKFDNQL
jgi:hypothetical protein